MRKHSDCISGEMLLLLLLYLHYVSAFGGRHDSTEHIEQAAEKVGKYFCFCNFFQKIELEKECLKNYETFCMSFNKKVVSKALNEIMKLELVSLRFIRL